MTGVRRLIPLTFGWADLPKSISVHGADPSIRLREPVPGVLCQLDGGWLLLDTGYNDPLLRDPWLRRRFHGNGNGNRNDHGIEAILPPVEGDSLEATFELAGVDPDEVVAVALSHLHYDHAGGLRHFAGRAPVHCQRRDLEYGLHGLPHHPAPERYGIFRIDFDDPRIDWRVADGEAEIAPGVVAVPTYGHTPGHQSFVVTLDDRLRDDIGIAGFVFAFDAADLQENIDHELAVGGFVGCRADDTVEPIRRLKAIAAEKGYRLVPGHDPDVWPRLTAELGAPDWPQAHDD